MQMNLECDTHASKITAESMLGNIEEIRQGSLSDNQFGFRRGVGTREAVLTLTQKVEKSIRKTKHLYHCLRSKNQLQRNSIVV